MRILLVSQMYPSAEAPDFGVFVQGLERELAARGHEIERVVLDRRGGGKLRHAKLAARAVRAARRFRPDVVYAHFLFPTGLSGLLAGLAARAPLVVTAHGQDVANLTEYPFVRPPARRVVKSAAAVIAVSEWLRGRLVASIPEAAAKTEVVDCGVDLERFRLLERTPGPSPAFLCVGSLIERKNVVRLANAFERARRGNADVRRRRAFASGRWRGGRVSTVTGYVPHDAVPGYLAAADVLCQPSLVEPFGQAALEALACGRTVVATRNGGPPEFVPPGAGVLVDPLDEDCARGGSTGRRGSSGPESGSPRGGRRARPQASGGSRRGDSRASRSRSASLISTSGRTASSIPASRASSSACS